MPGVCYSLYQMIHSSCVSFLNIHPYHADLDVCWMTYTTDTPAKTLSGLSEVRCRLGQCGNISSRQLISHKISRNVKTEEDPGETRDVRIAGISVQTAAGRMLKGREEKLFSVPTSHPDQPPKWKKQHWPIHAGPVILKSNLQVSKTARAFTTALLEFSEETNIYSFILPQKYLYALWQTLDRESLKCRVCEWCVFYFNSLKFIAHLWLHEYSFHPSPRW